jgi:hypothetical protein
LDEFIKENFKEKKYVVEIIITEWLILGNKLFVLEKSLKLLNDNN